MSPFDEDAPADLAIVGLGPAGLAAAVCAAQQGKQVLAFTDRTQYTRQQRVLLKDDCYIYELIKQDKARIESKDRSELTPSEHADLQFYTRLELEMTTQIKDIEQYLFRKLRDYSNVKIIPVTSRAPISRIGSTSTCNYIEQAGSPCIRYHCHHILAADGNKHQLANRVAEDLNKNITYSTSLFKPEHPYHATVQLIKAAENTTSNLYKARIKATKQTERPTLENQQWDSPEEPRYYIFPNEEKTKFCFSGEIPRAIFDEPDPLLRRDKLKTWASIFIEEDLDIDAHQLEFKDYSNPVTNPDKQERREKKEKLQTTVFKLDEFRVCNQPVVNLTAGVFACIGDARRTPYYRMAHGMGDGISLGVAFVNAMGQHHEFDQARYIKAVQRIDQEIDDLLNPTESPEDEVASVQKAIHETLSEHAIETKTTASVDDSQTGFTLRQ